MAELPWEWEVGYPRPPLISRGPPPWRMLFEPGYGPLLDICDEGERLVIYVDLPGVQREDIKLRVLADSLELEATRQTPKEAIHRERLNRFYRMFSLPYSVKAEKVAAKQENGVLTITLPKAEGRSVSVE